MTELPRVVLVGMSEPVAYFSNYFHLLIATAIVLLCAAIPALLFAMNDPTAR